MNILSEKLIKRFEPVEPMTFYREIFPAGELDEWGANTKGKYVAIAVEILKQPHDKQLIKRYTVTDDLDTIDELQQSEGFCIIAPISYVGKCRKSENARFMYALVVELDNLIEEDGLERLINQWSERVYWIPRPTYTVASGTGLHLYYLFEKPIPLFPNVVKELQRFKRELTEKIWNRHVTTDTGDKIQQESIFQPFRMVGTLTKKGDKTEAFRTGEPVSIEYMNRYVSPENQVTQIYKHKYSLADAKEKFPDWYEKRVVQHEPKGRWVCKRDLYDWWKRRITAEAVVGHRYYCMMILAIYAVKCNIPQEELERDCFSLMEVFEERTDNDMNHFTEKDVVSALQSFEDKGVVTYPLNSIVNRSGINVERNKRNFRKQTTHLKIARATLEIMNEDNRKPLQGRPKGSGTALEQVKEWQRKHLEGRKIDCERDTGLSRHTVLKWWERARIENLRLYTNKEEMAKLTVEQMEQKAKEIRQYVEKKAVEKGVSEEEAYEEFRTGKTRKERLQEQADKFILAESEVTIGLLDKMASAGIRSIQIVPDEEYEAAMFAQYLESLKSD